MKYVIALIVNSRPHLRQSSPAAIFAPLVHSVLKNTRPSSPDSQQELHRRRKSCKSAPLFSIASTMPLLQPFSFHAFALLPGVGMPLQQKHPTKMTPLKTIDETTRSTL